MSEHLSEEQAERYRARTLSPAEKLVVARHLAACDECNQRLNPINQSPARLADLRRNLRPRARETLHHLDYPLMEAYTDKRADAIDQEIVESHIELCTDCAAELQELQTLAVTMQQTATRKEAVKPPAPSLWTRFIGWIGLSSGGSALSVAGAAAAVALLAVVGVGVFMIYRSGLTGSGTRIAQTRNAVSPGGQGPTINHNNANTNTNPPNTNAMIAENHPPKANPYVIDLPLSRGDGEVYKIPPDRDPVMLRATVRKEANKQYEGRLVRPNGSSIPLGIVNAAKNGKVIFAVRASRLASGDYSLKIYRVPREGNEDDEVASIPLQIRK
jgi:hypothetical protein